MCKDKKYATDSCGIKEYFKKNDPFQSLIFFFNFIL